MKTRREEYGFDGINSIGLIPAIDFKQGEMSKLSRYNEVYEKIKILKSELQNLSPDSKLLLNNLTDRLIELENVVFEYAYRTGMADLMTAMTFNKLEITMPEYLVSENKISEESPLNGLNIQLSTSINRVESLHT